MRYGSLTELDKPFPPSLPPSIHLSHLEVGQSATSVNLLLSERQGLFDKSLFRYLGPV